MRQGPGPAARPGQRSVRVRWPSRATSGRPVCHGPRFQPPAGKRAITWPSPVPRGRRPGKRSSDPNVGHRRASTTSGVDAQSHGSRLGPGRSCRRAGAGHACQRAKRSSTPTGHSAPSPGELGVTGQGSAGRGGGRGMGGGGSNGAPGGCTTWAGRHGAGLGGAGGRSNGSFCMTVLWFSRGGIGGEPGGNPSQRTGSRLGPIVGTVPTGSQLAILWMCGSHLQVPGTGPWNLTRFLTACGTR